jgi:uncharacterized OsmC-like protein
MHSAFIENRGDTRSFASVTGYEFVMDVQGGGANPIDTLLASLAGCLGHQLCTFFRDRQISSSGFAVKTEADMTADNSRLADIRIIVDLKDTIIGCEAEPALINYVENCKIYKTLSANSNIVVVLKRINDI